MDPRLLDASDTGNVDQLYSLVRENFLILNAASLVDGDIPLHVASMAGQVNFVSEVLKLKTEFADELNQDGFGPLHITMARGNVDIVQELLKVGNRLCLGKGREERIPLHYSVIKGRNEVLMELVSACPKSIEKVTAWRESTLHLAVKNSRFEALKLLVVEFLLSGDAIDKDLIEVNARNEAGLTPLDILLLINNEADEAEIAKILTRLGATRARGLPSVVVATEDPEPPTDQSNRHHQSRRTWTDRCISFLKVKDESTQWLSASSTRKKGTPPGCAERLARRCCSDHYRYLSSRASTAGWTLAGRFRILKQQHQRRQQQELIAQCWPGDFGDEEPGFIHPLPHPQLGRILCLHPDDLHSDVGIPNPNGAASSSVYPDYDTAMGSLTPNTACTIVSWVSQLWKVVALLTVEAENVMITEASKEIM
ncbi:hypothetical protein NL676_011984 [Syzygium grande]|nr:hypothetical protein NL676_011984 [Syzygium grande]